LCRREGAGRMVKLDEEATRSGIAIAEGQEFGLEQSDVSMRVNLKVSEVKRLGLYSLGHEATNSTHSQKIQELLSE
jgi:hypothetical protein